MAVWGSGTSISGETFDGIFMGFSVPEAQQQTPNPAWATGGTFWIAVALGPRGRRWWLIYSSLHLLVGGSHPSAPLVSVSPTRESQRLLALGNAMIFSAGSAAACSSLGISSHSSRAGAQIGSTHRSMIGHGSSPQRQVGGQTIQNVAASGPGGAGRARSCPHSRFLCAEASSSG